MQPRFNTLRLRFAVWTAGLLLVGLLGLSAYTYVRIGRSLEAVVDDSLRLSATQAISAVHYANGQLSVEGGIPETTALANLPEERLVIRLLDANGQILESFGGYTNIAVAESDLQAAQAGRSRFSTVEIPDAHDPARLYTEPVMVSGQMVGLVQVGETLDGVRDTQERLLHDLRLAIPLLVLGAAVAGYWLAARALRPIDTIIRTAQRISTENLHERLDHPASNDEVGRLASTLDAMLDRLEASFARERRFTADASHELRTPLTAMLTILSVVRERRRTPDDYEQALDDLAEEAQRLRTMTEDLLWLARSDTGQRPVFAPVQLAQMLGDVVETLEPLAEARGLRIETAIASDLPMRGDPSTLVRLWLNLLDNALKYTHDGVIRVQAEPSDTGIRVTISDTGIGIAADDLPHVFERFYRADLARSGGGTGLGLPIAREIVLAHGGTLELHSQPGQGTTVQIELPAQPARTPAHKELPT